MPVAPEDNVFTLSEINFTPTRRLAIRPVIVRPDSLSGAPDPLVGEALSALHSVLPLAADGLLVLGPVYAISVPDVCDAGAVDGRLKQAIWGRIRP